MSESQLTNSQRIKAAIISGIASPLIAAIGTTLRFKVEGIEHYDAVVTSGRQPILAFWHGRILGGIYYFRDRRIVVITSQNFDGEWIARIITRFGFGTARGSTSRGGARALVQMRRELTEGRAVAFTLDGPRGPARVAQAGAAWLAGATRHPIIPFHIESDRFWTMASWDRTQIPKPFSTMAVVIGPPMEVAGTETDVTERARVTLESTLAVLEGRARALLGASPHS